MFRSLLLASLLLFSTACGMKLPVELQPPSTLFIESVRPLQSNGQTICSVTSINDTLDLWLGAKHCVDAPNLTIAGVEAIPIHESSDDVDIVIFQAKGTEVRAVPMSPVAPVRGTYIQVYGYPVAYDGDYFQGHVSNPRGWLTGIPVLKMRYDMTSCGGNSGSAVVNRAGQIVSVLQFGHSRPCDGFTGGATYEDVKELAAFFE
jgi:hypothetical protein